MTQVEDRRTRSVQWDLPVVEQTDVLVVGGGSAGIAASTASAWTGARTLLVDRYGFLGGTSTAGLVGPFMTSYDSLGEQPIVRGVFQRIVDRMVAIDGAIDPSQVGEESPHAAYIKLGHSHVTPFDPEALKLAAFDLVSDAGVELMLHTQFIDVLLDGETVTGVIVANKGGLGVIEAKVVVDTSADGDVAVKAGAPYEIGRPEDGRVQPATMFFRVGDVDDDKVDEWVRKHRKLHGDERLFECIVREAKESGEFPVSRNHIGIYREPRRGEWRVNTTRIHDIDGTNPRDLTRAEIEGRKQVIELMRFFQRRCPGFENAKLLETGAQVGIRETRRIIGEYLLTGDDVLNGRRFEDAIARYAYPVDIHDPTGSGGRLEAIKGRFYDIPYRCLVPKGVANLLTAGRCISIDHVAFGSVRVIPACYATGHAAGAAASLCAQQGTPARDVHVPTLQQTLRDQDAIL